MQTIYPQIGKDKSFLLSRFRISGGFVTVLSEEVTFEINHPFLNISYRSSDFDKFSSSFKLKGAYEVGLNALLIADKTPNTRNAFSLYPLPYVKVGPELRLHKNLFLAVSGGLAFIYFASSFGVIPFTGLNGFYLIRLGEKTCLEFESGFHAPLTSLNKLPFLTYFTVGLSFD